MDHFLHPSIHVRQLHQTRITHGLTGASVGREASKHRSERVDSNNQSNVRPTDRRGELTACQTLNAQAEGAEIPTRGSEGRDRIHIDSTTNESGVVQVAFPGALVLVLLWICSKVPLLKDQAKATGVRCRLSEVKIQKKKTIPP